MPSRRLSSSPICKTTSYANAVISVVYTWHPFWWSVPVLNQLLNIFNIVTSYIDEYNTFWKDSHPIVSLSFLCYCQYFKILFINVYTYQKKYILPQKLKLKIELPYDPVTLFLCIHLKEMKTKSWRYMHPHFHCSIIYLSVHQWIDEQTNNMYIIPLSIQCNIIPP